MWRRWGKTEWTWLKIMYVKGITTGINDKFSKIFNCKNYVYALFSILSRYITSVIYFINGFERLLFKSEFYMLVRLSVKTLFCFVFYFVLFFFFYFLHLSVPLWLILTIVFCLFVYASTETCLAVVINLWIINKYNTFCKV